MSCRWFPWPPWPSGSGGGSDPPAPPPPPAPLLLVPGICGSQLAVRPTGAPDGDDGERCWVKLRSADSSFQKLWGKYSKSSGRVELLLPGREACVPAGADDSGLYPISVLDPDVGFAVSDVRYFEPLINHLQAQGYEPGVTLFGFGYNFIQSCRDSGRALLARLQEVSRRCGGARVDLLTHSLGGLVVRSLLADYPAEYEALVGRWVALGCPFGGAPGYTVDALLTGVQFGGSLGDFFFVERATFLQAALQAPSLYELLPPLDFPWARPPPQLTLWLKEPLPPPDGDGGSQAGTERAAAPAGSAEAGAAAPDALPCTSHQLYMVHVPPLPPQRQQQQPVGKAARQPLAVPLQPGIAASHHSSGSGSSSAGGDDSSRSSASGTAALQSAHQYVFNHAHLPGLLTALLKDNAVSVEGASVALPFEPELWALGQATHAAWGKARLPPGCAFYNLHGAGVSTPYDVQYGAWWYALQNLAAVPHANAAFSFIDGDGTVPSESATAHGLQPAATAAVKAVSHRGLVASEAVWAQVLAWLHEPLPQPASSGSPAALLAPAQQPPPVLSRGAPELGAPTYTAAACAQAELAAPLLAAAEREAAEPGAAAAAEVGCFNPLVWWALL